MMETEIQKKWEAAAWALPELESLRAPFAVLAGEALDVVRFFLQHWEPTVDPNDRTLRPGLRNRLGQLVYDHMQRIRSAARLVFRRHPELVRKVTSAYFRR